MEQGLAGRETQGLNIYIQLGHGMQLKEFCMHVCVRLCASVFVRAQKIKHPDPSRQQNYLRVQMPLSFKDFQDVLYDRTLLEMYSSVNILKANCCTKITFSVNGNVCFSNTKQLRTHLFALAN